MVSNKVIHNEKLSKFPERYENDLEMLREQGLPTSQLDLIYALFEIEECKAFALCNIYNWGYIQGKREERARKQRLIGTYDGTNIQKATLKQIIINCIKHNNDLSSLKIVYEAIKAGERS